MWEGDVLVIYGVCAPVIYLCVKSKFLYNWHSLFGLQCNGILKSLVNDGSAPLGDFGRALNPMSDEVILVPLTVLQGFGAMLIGVGLYRSGFISEQKKSHYKES